MKNLLIISPSFPPVNAADMHRVRQSVSYFETYGWKPIVVVVDPAATEGNIDTLLSQTLPEGLEVIAVKAFSTKWTRKIGLGSLALRSLWFYFKVINTLLKKRKFDLVYFSTTMFPVMILGAYWKKHFAIPFVIDMQDPWHSDHYLRLPADQRPPKFWFSYRLNKYLEPVAMKKADGIIAVSSGYCNMLQQRYANITKNNCIVIPFGAFAKDFDVLRQNQINNIYFDSTKSAINVVYVGRGGHDMHLSVSGLFIAFQQGLLHNPQLFSKVHIFFIGTSYAPKGKGTPTLAPLAQKYGVSDLVSEFTDRISYFQVLQVLQDAHMLVIPGSTDPNYTASKLYPYILAKKPLMAIFNEQSSVVSILNKTNAGEVVTFNTNTDLDNLGTQVYEKWSQLLMKMPFQPETNWQAFEPYTAQVMTKKQVEFFDKILENN